MKSPWVRWFIRLGVGVSFALIGWFLWEHANELRAVDWRAMALPIGLGLLLYGLALGVQGAVWIRLFTSLTGTVWNGEDVRIYFTTHLMRRLPGAPWYMAGRAAVYRERSPEMARAAWAVNLLEWSGLILSGLVWVAWGYWRWMGLISALVLLFGSVQLLRRWQPIARRMSLEHRPSSSLLYYALLAYEGQWFLAALMLHLLLSALSPTRVPGFLETGTLWATSGVVSNLAVFAPMGLGIRELSLVAVLTPQVGLGCAALAALLMRMLFTVGDLLWSVVAIGLILRFNTP
jgi:hypothetical protein